MDIVEYKRIVIKLRPTLLWVAREITGNLEDAEDVVQDVCLKIWHFRERFCEFQNVEAYGTTMVKNLSIDRVRRRKSSTDEMELINKESNTKLPDLLLEEKEVSEVIQKIISTLPPLQHRILQLKDIEGYESDEIAELTGIAPEAVRNNLSRARKRVRELYLMYYQIKQKNEYRYTRIWWNDDNGRKQKTKFPGNLNIRPVTLDILAQGGVNDFGFFVSYSPFSLFRNNKGPEANQATIGLQLYF